MIKSVSTAAALAAALVAGCGGGGGAGPVTHALGGTVAGLASGRQLVLLSGAGTQTTVSANGNFRFGDRLPDGVRYNLQVQQQPLNQTCQISNGANASGIKADVSDITVVCADNPAVLGGTVSGLPAGTALTVANGNQSTVTLSANGRYSLPVQPSPGTPYNVIISSQPTGANCVVINGSGTAGNTAVGNIDIQCSRGSVTVSGDLAGLALGGQLQLRLSGSGLAAPAPLSLTVNGAFNFPTPITFGGDYLVTIDSQPAGQTCTLSNDRGTTITAPVTQLRVSCAGNRHTLGGQVTGLAVNPGGQPLMLRNGQDVITVMANGPFQFPSLLADGARYTVSIASQPTGQTCQVFNDSATSVSAAVSNVSVQCLAYVWRSRLVAGSGQAGTVDEAGTAARFAAPTGVAMNALGDLFVTDFSSSRIRSILMPLGVVSTLAGSSVPGAVNSVAPLLASFRGPTGIVMDRSGHLYVADSGNHVIRQIVAGTGEVRTWAGSGIAGFADGASASAQFNNPRGLAIDPQGNLIVADTGNHVIRRITPAGQVSLIAGTPRVSGRGDGAAASASFHGPSGLAVNAQGMVFVADTQNHVIRVIDTATNQVSTVAGSGMAGWQDGSGAFAAFNLPVGVAVDGPSTIFVTDSGNHAVRMLQIVGTQGSALTIAGNGGAGYREGIGANALLNQPSGLIVDAAGNLFITEGGGHRVRSLVRSPN